MKAPTTKVRFAEAQKLLDYGFSNYSYEQFAKKGDMLKTINVDKGLPSSINLVYEENSGALIKKGDNKDIEEIVTIDNNISAPISKGQKLGEITYMINNQVVGKVNLISQSDVKKIGVGTMFPKVFLSWFRILR